jgi:hypothetical protein
MGAQQPRGAFELACAETRQAGLRRAHGTDAPGAMMLVKPLDTLLAIKVVSLEPGLCESDRRVATALLEHFNRKTGRCDPGQKRLARLLGYCERTIIRATKKLEKVGLFKKVRHGGYSNRNSYEPNWARLHELHAAWKARWREHSRTAMSPATGQESHLQGDTNVSQTYSINNLHKGTDSRGLTKKEGVSRRSFFASPKPSADAARNQAEKRWATKLHEMFADKPVTYGEVIAAVDQAMSTAATDAELARRGAGIDFILKQLKLR